MTREQDTTLIPGIRVRPLDRSDMEQMNALHRTRDDVPEPGDAEKRTQLLEWLAFHNPFAGKEATYYVAEDGGKIVAFQGRMPVEFVIDGSRQKGYYIHDTYVHPDYRTKGLGFSLITALAQATEQQSDSFFCVLGGTPLNLKIQRRMGYHELPPAPQFVKLLNPHKQLTKLLKVRPLVDIVNPLARALLSLTDLVVLNINRSSLHTFPVERFDQRFDQLMERIKHSIGICSWKHAAYLNWKYVDRPHKRDTILAVGDDREVSGFVVLALTRGAGRRGGVIMDLIAEPDNHSAISALFREVVKYFRSVNVDSIRYVGSNNIFGAIARRFLFLRSNEGKTLLVGNLNRVPHENGKLKNTDNWHVSLGESDAFMLSS